MKQLNGTLTRGYSETMVRNQLLRDTKTGQFAGSIGKGKTRTPQTLPSKPFKNNGNLAELPEHQEVLLALTDERVFSTSVSVRVKAAEQTPIPRVVSEYLVQDSHSDVLSALASNPTLDGDILAKIAEHTFPWVRLAAIESGRLPLKKLEQMINDRNESVRAAVAEEKRISTKSLTRLAQKEDESVVLQSIAINPNSSPQILQKLAKSQYGRVRAAVTWNDKTSPELLTQLSQDHFTETRSGVAAHLNTPVDVLVALAEEEGSEVRWQIIENPNLPLEQLRIIKDTEPEIMIRERVDAILEERYKAKI